MTATDEILNRMERDVCKASQTNERKEERIYKFVYSEQKYTLWCSLCMHAEAVYLQKSDDIYKWLKMLLHVYMLEGFHDCRANFKCYTAHSLQSHILH